MSQTAPTPSPRLIAVQAPIAPGSWVRTLAPGFQGTGTVVSAPFGDYAYGARVDGLARGRTLGFHEHELVEIKEEDDGPVRSD